MGFMQYCFIIGIAEINDELTLIEVYVFEWKNERFNSIR